MGDLKPCPFCGGEAYFREDTSHSTAYFVGCSDENCFGDNHWGETEAEAVSAWNRRATTPEVTALVEALRPFAKAADIKLCGDWHDDESIQRTDVAFYVKFGDLRAASAAITEWEAANA